MLAHQERGQLGKELAQAIGNCATKIAFRPAEDDLPYVHRLVGETDPAALRGLGVGEAIVSCGRRLASLKTELCTAPVLRDARETARQYAEQHYAAVTAPSKRKRRPRVYDTFGGEE